MFDELMKINTRPKPFQFYTADELWTDKHTSMKMLEYHLDDSVEFSSRKKEFIDHSVEWIASHFGVNSNTSIADFGCGPVPELQARVRGAASGHDPGPLARLSAGPSTECRR